MPISEADPRQRGISGRRGGLHHEHVTEPGHRGPHDEVHSGQHLGVGGRIAGQGGLGERARLLGKMLSSLAAINVVRSNIHCYDYITFNVKCHA